MAIIKAPNTEYNGVSAGVQFSNGVGECSDPYLISWFQEKGYTVVPDAAEMKLPVPEPETEPESKPETEPEPKPEPEPETEPIVLNYDQMSRAELFSACEAAGIKVARNAKTETLIARLREHQEEGAD